LQPNPFGAARPREQVIAERTGKKEQEVLQEQAAKEWKKNVSGLHFLIIVYSTRILYLSKCARLGDSESNLDSRGSSGGSASVLVVNHRELFFQSFLESMLANGL